MKKLKQVLSNKNTVTIIGLVLIVLVLYVFYNMRINQATNPIRVPYAKVDIPPRTKITKDMIDYMDIIPTAVRGDIYTNAETQIIEPIMYSNANCTIPAGSLFYTNLLIRERNLPDSYLVELEPKKDNMVPYNFDVNIKSTYGNSMRPGSEVDLYFRGKDAGGLTMVGLLYKKVRVLSVKDSSGRPVFDEESGEDRTPSQMILEVDNTAHLILRVAEKLKSSVEIILVPSGTKLEDVIVDKDAVEVSSEEIVEYIKSFSTLYVVEKSTAS